MSDEKTEMTEGHENRAKSILGAEALGAGGAPE